MRWLVVLGILIATRIAAAAPCPTGWAFTDVMRTAFPAEMRTTGEHELPLDAKRLRCRPLHGPKPLALVTYRVDADIVLGAVIRGDEVLWASGSPDCTPCITYRSFDVVDLDADGHDELLIHVHKAGHMATSADWLDVMTLDATGVPVGVDQPPLFLADASRHDHFRCASELRVKARRLELTGACKGSWIPESFPLGKHVYAMRDGKLVEN